MATGLPKTKWGNGDSAQQGVSQGDVTLAYAGKQPGEVVLKSPRATAKLVWKPSRVDAVNRFYYGENLGVLSLLLDDPLVRGQVRVVYIDPPFATRSIFQSRTQTDAYKDLLVGSSYIEFLRQRLIVLRELMANDGSIYVHLDDNMGPYIKVVMDEIFGRQNFRNWITRKKCNPKNYTRKTFGNVTDYLLFYTKSDSYVWHRPVEGWTDERAAKEYEYIDPASGRRFKKVPVHAPGLRNGETGKPWRGKLPPPGKHWQFQPRKLDEFDAKGLIYWSPNGNPRRKLFLDESAGVAVQDLWLEFRDAHNQNIRVSGYPTEKNPELLARVIEASSNTGDLVLDCFAGSGTTLAAASRLGRRWIGVDNSPEAIVTTLKRFAHGLEPMGDFVGKRKPKADQRAVFPLFKIDEDKISGETHRELYRKHQIGDFSLYAAASITAADLKMWKKWTRRLT